MKSIFHTLFLTAALITAPMAMDDDTTQKIAQKTSEEYKKITEENATFNSDNSLIYKLPDETILHILSFINDPKNLSNAALVTKRLSQITKDVLKNPADIEFEKRYGTQDPNTITEVCFSDHILTDFPEIRAFPRKVTTLANLSKLDLRGTGQLTTIPYEIKNLRNLKFLALGGIEQSVLRSVLYEVQTQGKKFTLEESLSFIKSVKQVQFRDALELPTSLEELILDYCKLTEIPKPVLNLNNLKKLSIRMNLIETIGEEISQLSSLEELDLDYTPTIKHISVTAIQTLENFYLLGILECYNLEEENSRELDKVMNTRKNFKKVDILA